MTSLFRLCGVAILSGVLAAGCAARGVRIAELKDRPDKYERKTVRVEGVVTRSFGAGLLGQVVPFQTYSVDDGTGEITVLSRGGNRQPVKGSRVTVKGVVRDVAVFNGMPLGLHLEERDLDIRRN